MKGMAISFFCMLAGMLPLCGQPLQCFENASFFAGVNRETGALETLINRKTGWNIIPEGSGMSFDMTVLRPDGSKSVVSGRAQQRPECMVYRDSVVFRWSHLKLNNSGQVLDIEFTGTVRYDLRDGLVFSGTVMNDSDCRVETLNWPMIGGISLPDPDDRLHFRTLSYTALSTVELYPRLAGYYVGGCNLPEQAFATIGSDRQGIYISCKDPEMNEYIRLNYEVTPTAEYNESLGTVMGALHYADRAKLRYQARATRHIFVAPGERYRMTEVVVQPFCGDWQAAADIYKTWRATWFVAPHRAAWLEDVNSWQQLQINSSESRINFKIKDLVSYAEECRKYGVDALQITGWNWGGQDRGMPVHDVDPRLGTTEEFRKAIAACQALGVKIILFTKFTWIEMTAPWFDTFKNYIVSDEDGEYRMAGGYRYNTYTQLTSFNNRRFGVLCYLDDDCRKLICEEFKKCIDLGADGMNYDENQHHAGTHLCYNPDHGHKVASYIYRGDNLLAREFLELTRKYNPDFVMTGEGSYDIQGQYYATYTRQPVDHTPLMRYIDPELPIVAYFTDHLDKNRINMCLMNKYSLCYEPRNFKGRLGEFPRMMEYGKKVDDLRRRYKDQLWNVVYNSTFGAEVAGEDILYSVLNRKSNGKRAVVVLNKNTEQARKAAIDLGNVPRERLMLVSPEHPDPVPFENEVTIEPQGAVVIIER